MKNNISGVTVTLSSTRTALNGRNFEVRVGNEPVSHGTKDRILSNELCGKFVRYDDNDRKVYMIMCEKQFFVEYVTIQIIEKNVQLAINELEVITTSEGIKSDHNYKLR